MVVGETPYSHDSARLLILPNEGKEVRVKEVKYFEFVLLLSIRLVMTVKDPVPRFY